MGFSGCGTNGAYAKAMFNNATTTSITIGAGGAGVVGYRGGNGGTTSFGTYLVCPGGNGAPAGTVTASNPVAGSSATNATEAPQPTIQSGVMIFTATPSPTTSCSAGFVYGAALLCYPPFTHIGGGFGAGANSIFVLQNSSAQSGFSGKSGRVIIWEYT